MIDGDGFRLGWQHADLATSWALGALAYLAVIVGGGYLVFRLWLPLVAWITHQVRVHRIRRQARRAGRDVAPRWLGKGVPPYNEPR